ncbi:hypothetical protein, partial [Streptomyces chiangmaiensis]
MPAGSAGTTHRLPGPGARPAEHRFLRVAGRSVAWVPLVLLVRRPERFTGSRRAARHLAALS